MGPLPESLPLALFLLEIVLLAVLLGLEHKALGLDDIEEQIAHQVGVRTVGHLQAGAESAKVDKQKYIIR